MTTHYSVAFAAQRPATDHVAMILRAKNDWQRGKINLPGGHIEENETPVQAAVRELHEETGLIANEHASRELGEIIIGPTDDPVAIVHVVRCPYDLMIKDVLGNDWYRNLVTKSSDEGQTLFWPWDRIKIDARMLPELQVAIPLCIANVDGWMLTPGTNEYDWHIDLSVR